METAKGREITNYAGNSRWTNPMRGHAIHLAEAGKNPICGKKYQNGASDRPDFNLADVTCEKCLKIYKRDYSLTGTELAIEL